MDTFLRDAKHSIRAFLNTPGFTITAVIALALGIGATTAIFSVVNAVLLKPLPVFEPDRFVMLMSTWVTETGEHKTYLDASPARFAHWRAQSSVIRDVSAFFPGVMNYTGGDVVEQLRSMKTSADFFRCWGIRMVRGRAFTPEEDLPNRPRLAVISEGLWTRRFASDPQILGKTITLDGEPYPVIGIAADSTGLREFGPTPDVFLPFQLDPNSTDDVTTYFRVVARLKPGITWEQANVRVRASAAEYRAKLPDLPSLGPKDGFTLPLFREALVADIRPLLLILLSAVGLVLLIACANVANLLLARATWRRREIAIQAAIGATRGRMIRQLLTESVILAMTGGALGLWLGYGGIRALLAVNTADLPLLGPDGSAVNIDWRVMAFALAVSLVTGIVFGLFPAFQASRADLNSVLKESNWTGSRKNKVGAVLVVSETSLAVILLVGSALLIRSFEELYMVDRGFETKKVVTMRTSLAGPKYWKSAVAADTIRRGLEHIRALPGVVAASATCCIPLLEGGYGQPFEIVGRSPVNSPFGGWVMATSDYFEVFRIPVKRGRTFTDRDDGKGPPVVVISEGMARQFWKDTDPLWDRIVIGKGMMKEFQDDTPRQIVGIVGDVRGEKLNADPLPTMYVPQAQIPDAENAWVLRFAPLSWAVRTQPAQHGLTPVIRERLREATGLPVSDVRSMDEVMSLSSGKQRFNMLLMTVFGCCALLLAAIGIFGLMAYTVEQRMKEIGIRLALGAEPSQVKNMVVRQGMVLAMAGVVIGTAAALSLSRLIGSLLFGVRAWDPIVFLAVPLVLGAVALLAVWIPANRASRVNPIDSLHYE